MLTQHFYPLKRILYNLLLLTFLVILQFLERIQLIIDHDFLHMILSIHKKHHDAFLKELKEAIIKDTEERSFHDQLLLNKEDQKCWDIWYTFHEEKDSAVTVTYTIYITDEHALKVIEKYRPYLEKY